MGNVGPSLDIGCHYIRTGFVDIRFRVSLRRRRVGTTHGIRVPFLTQQLLHQRQIEPGSRLSRLLPNNSLRDSQSNFHVADLRLKSRGVVPNSSSTSSSGLYLFLVLIPDGKSV